MDIETGVYTAGYGEVYKVTWSMSGYDSGSRGYIHLYKNFLQMPESILWISLIRFTSTVKTASL